MARLRVLGTIDVDADPGEMNARELLAKPKLTALTVYLLLAHRNGWCRRDELAALFWPESDQTHARSSLSQALYQVRQHLGPAGIETRGSEDVRLPPDALPCDARQFRQAVAQDEHGRACDLYAGELMPAFHLPDAPEFHHWLERVRESLRRQVLASAWRQAEECEATGDLAGAAHYLRLAGSHSLLDPMAVARSIAGLARADAPSEALALFDQHRVALQSEMGVHPDAALVELADAIRQAALARTPDINGRAAPAGSSSGAEHSDGGARPHRRWQAGAALLVFAVIIVAVVAQLPSVRPRPPLDPSRLLILPFTDGEDAGSTEGASLATTLPISLRPLLEGTAGIQTVSEQQANLALRARGLPPQGELSAAIADDVAESVGAGHYLTGRVLTDAGRRQLHAELVETRTGTARVVVRLRLDSLDTFAVAHRLAGELLVGLLGEQSRSPQLLSHPLEALREYVDGWEARRDTRYLDAVRHFHTAMRIDSTFALGALAYREASQWLPDNTPHRLALVLADSILAREGTRLGVADQALAAAMLATYREHVDGPTVLATLRNATLRAPDRASAWLLLGDFLLHDGRMLAIPNSLRLAEAALDSARRLDSTLPEPARHLTEIQFTRRDSATARRYLAAHPPDTAAFDHLAWVAAALLGDSAALAGYGRRLPRGPSRTWVWMLLWSQRAGAGFGHADSAAVLLRANPALDESLRSGEGFVLAHYRLNRGRTLDPTQPIRRGERYPAARLRPTADLEMGLPLPDGWVDLNSVAELALAGVGELEPPEHLWAVCHLGTWHALRGRAIVADSLARVLHRWKDDTALRRKPVARTCPYVIRALDDTTAGLVALRLADSVLLSEPAGTLRTDLTRWNLLLAQAYRDRGRPDLGLPLTTRLGFIVEGSAYQTPALLLEGELSLATGDSARAARAYTLASAFLSKPDPALQAEADSVRALARQLSASACGGDCGPYRW